MFWRRLPRFVIYIYVRLTTRSVVLHPVVAIESTDDYVDSIHIHFCLGYLPAQVGLPGSVVRNLVTLDQELSNNLNFHSMRLMSTIIGNGVVQQYST